MSEVKIHKLVVIYELSGEILFTSAENKLFEKNRLQKNNFFELISPGDVKWFREKIQILKPGAMLELNLRFATPHGFFILFSKHHLVKKDNQFYVHSSISYPSSLAKSEKLLSVNDHFKFLADNVNIPAVITDLEGTLLYANELAVNFLKINLGNAGNLSVLSFYQKRNQRDEFLEKLKIKKSISNYELNIKDAEDSEKTILLSSSLYNDSGRSVILSYVIDITYQKRIERDIKIMSKRLQIAAELANIGIWEWDKKTGSILWNDALHDIVIPEDKNSNEFLSEHILNHQKLKFLKFIKNPDEDIFEDEYQFNLGKERYIKTIGYKSYDFDNNFIKVVGVSWDITDIRQAENKLKMQKQELLKANEELDHFVYSASHDLKAPISSVLGLINISKYTVDEKEKRYYLKLMQDSIKKLDRVIQQVTNYSRNARLEIHNEKLDFRKIVDEVLAELSFIENRSKINIQVKVTGSHPFYSDKDRVKIILKNLVSNSILYHRLNIENPYIRININQGKENAVIKVEDNGLGIIKDEQDKVFNMFHRSSEFSQGSGLGLYIVKEILLKVSGKISFHSEINKGTFFKIEIPNK